MIEDKSSDLETALFLTEHIKNPCEVYVEGKVENIRNFYIREAERILPKMKNNYAADFLRNIIDEYR